MNESALAAAGIDMSNVYLVVGTLIVMNLGAIGTGLAFIIKLVWLAAKYDSRVERMEKDLHNAFAMIKEIKQELRNYGE